MTALASSAATWKGAVGAIVLGAGLSSRFGESDKLGAGLRGKPLAHHILPALQPFDWADKILVCRDKSDWIEAYTADGFRLVENVRPDQGMLSSLKAGVDDLEQAALAMIFLADMPFVTAEHVRRLLSLAISSHGRAVASKADNYRGPPAIFPIEALKQLPASGEGGARSLLASALFVKAPATSCLMSIPRRP
ncbi:MobA-related protein [Bradyrhizobium lupini HPC(L)]|uniref:MobA-related protein n=1 Tax=Bradyrhizobium lupini HPC(L) TaxID=1229491 RepID=A0ABP2RPI5_RHILU|nr:MobA-related protein [Bradyrhizobium lupini HPC(L)]